MSRASAVGESQEAGSNQVVLARLGEVTQSQRELVQTVNELKEAMAKNAIVIQQMRRENTELNQLVRQLLGQALTSTLGSTREAPLQAIGSTVPGALEVTLSSLPQGDQQAANETPMQVDNNEAAELPFAQASVPSPGVPRVGSLRPFN